MLWLIEVLSIQAKVSKFGGVTNSPCLGITYLSIQPFLTIWFVVEERTISIQVRLTNKTFMLHKESGNLANSLIRVDFDGTHIPIPALLD